LFGGLGWWNNPPTNFGGKQPPCSDGGNNSTLRVGISTLQMVLYIRPTWWNFPPLHYRGMGGRLHPFAVGGGRPPSSFGVNIATLGCRIWTTKFSGVFHQKN